MPTAKAPKFIGCTPKFLPAKELVAAAERAVEINPANRSDLERISTLKPDFEPDAQFIAVSTSKYWGAKGVDLPVQFLDTSDSTLMNRILAHMNVWGDRANIRFRLSAQGTVRISRQADGYWSYLGTDVMSIAAGRATMNLQGFTKNTSEAEFRRVVRHETGHTLGCPHEHMRRAIIELLDPNKTVAYFRRTQGWSQATTIQQVLTPLEERSLVGSPPLDQTSIMCYQLPGECTKNGRPIPGGDDIIESDFAYMATLYPKAVIVDPGAGDEDVTLNLKASVLVKALTDKGYKVTR